MKSQRRCTNLLAGLLFIPYLIAVTCGAQSLPAPRTVDLSAPDSTSLKATYFGGWQARPGVLLLHQCNRQRKVWDGLAEQLATAGVNVLTLDYRGFGESGSDRFDKLPQGMAAQVIAEKC